MKPKLLIIIAPLVLLASCLGINQVREDVSSFDGATQITVSPGFIYSSESAWSYGNFMLGLAWASDMPNDSVYFVAKIPGKIVNISSSEGLQFMIDGELVKLSSSEIFTQFDTEKTIDTYNTDSVKNFRGSISLVQKLLDSKTAKVKLVTRDGYIEGAFQSSKSTAAIDGFRKFIQRYNARTSQR